MNMTNEQQQIAIAVACGKCVCTTYKKQMDWESAVCDGCGQNPFLYEHNIPNYTGDLNAMHEAEKRMHEDGNRGYEYDMALCKVVKAYENVGEPCNHMRLYHATAAQRAEAFLRTLNLWEATATPTVSLPQP